MPDIPSYRLNNKTKIPAIGFGTWELEDGDEAYKAVAEALNTGYRLIDTAKIYRNEKSVGLAIRKSHIPREEVLLTTKLWPSDFGYETAKEAFTNSLEMLGLEYIDLYLMHWPGKGSSRRAEAWKALKDIRKSGQARSIGVSNYKVEHLVELTDSNVQPAINQIEFHPYIYEEQRPILEFCKKQGIVVEAYSPLSHGLAIDNITAYDIAQKHHRTAAQVLLRWAHQHGTVPIPKSARTEHTKENIDIFDFELTTDEMARLNSLSH